jgi:hypothetical protein
VGDRSKADEQESRKCLVATRQESTKVLRNWVRVAGLLFGRGAHDLQEIRFPTSWYAIEEHLRAHDRALLPLRSIVSDQRPLGTV